MREIAYDPNCFYKQETFTFKYFKDPNTVDGKIYKYKINTLYRGI